MSDVSLIDGHIDNAMSDEDIIKAFEICYLSSEDCGGCPFLNEFLECMNTEDSKLLNLVEDVLNRQKAEIEFLRASKGLDKAEFNEIKAELELRNAEIERLKQKPLYDFYKEKSEAIKDFAERLCESRVTNDPVVIAVKVELKRWEENG